MICVWRVRIPKGLVVLKMKNKNHIQADLTSGVDSVPSTHAMRACNCSGHISTGCERGLELVHKWTSWPSWPSWVASLKVPSAGLRKFGGQNSGLKN